MLEAVNQFGVSLMGPTLLGAARVVLLAQPTVVLP